MHRTTPRKEDQKAYLNHIAGGEITLMLLQVLTPASSLAAQILATILPLVVQLIDGYWHHTRKMEICNQMKLIGRNVGIFGAVLILARIFNYFANKVYFKI